MEKVYHIFLINAMVLAKNLFFLYSYFILNERGIIWLIKSEKIV